MPAPVTICPARRSDLFVAPRGDDGRYVVKDPFNGSYFGLGEEEHWLLAALDGKQTADEICVAFQKQFDEPLSRDEFAEFVELAQSRGFLQPAEPKNDVPAPHPGAHAPRLANHAPRLATQSLLCW